MSTNLALFPTSCSLSRSGLTLTAGLSREEWLGVGNKLCEVAGATPWMLGDFLAYGDAFFIDSKGAKRIPDGIYAQFSAMTGLAEQTLMNAKSVCMALPISRRREKLTFAHAAEIVGRVPEKDYDFWINKVVTEGISSKALREQLRKSTAIHKPEANDSGVRSFLETTRQYVRDGMAEPESRFTPQYCRELLRILDPLLKRIG